MENYKQIITDYYEKQCQLHTDVSWKVAGYPSVENQYGTYVMLGRVIDERYPSRVLDVGCGQGDMFQYVDERGAELHYEGIDLCESMIDYARAKFPEGKFKVQDLLDPEFKKEYEYVIAANAMNLLIPGSWPERYAHVKRMAQKMFDLSKKACAFNLLTPYDDEDEDKEEDMCYYEPSQIIDICLGISRKLHIDHKTSGYDYAVYLYK